MTRRFCAHGLSILEMIAVVVCIVVCIAILLPVLARPTVNSWQMKDAVHVRGIQHSMAIWASQNKGLFPLPSLIDVENNTVADLGAGKDTTANILSILIYTGGIAAENAVSFAETNHDHIAIDADYMYDAPSTAIDRSKALWDPAFSADFTNGSIGNTSYAHILPGGGREALWKDTFVSTEPVIANRGPEVRSVNAAGAPTFVLAASNTLLIHGSRSSWEGNVAYNDGHVVLETRTNPTTISYKAAAGKVLPDNLFFDESDDATGHNVWMSIWTKAGGAKSDFKPIWD